MLYGCVPNFNRCNHTCRYPYELRHEHAFKIRKWHIFLIIKCLPNSSWMLFTMKVSKSIFFATYRPTCTCKWFLWQWDSLHQMYRVLNFTLREQVIMPVRWHTTSSTTMMIECRIADAWSFYWFHDCMRRSSNREAQSTMNVENVN